MQSPGEKTRDEGGQKAGARPDVYYAVEGLHVNRLFSEQMIRSALSYAPQDGDVFVVSYPKCGSTWLHYVVQAALKIGAGLEAPELDVNGGADLWKAMPFFEIVGAEGARDMPRPGAIKTHLPFQKLQYSPGAKYIYIARNPYDCCVSFYHHTKRLPTYMFEDGTFDEFFDMFVQGKVDFGDYFDHLLSWYEHRDKPNVLLLTYEELKKDTRGWVLKIGDFLGKREYGDNLREHPERVEKVLALTSVDNMKALNSKLMNWTEVVESMPAEAKTAFTKKAKEMFGDVWDKSGQGEFVRKGVVGDWKSYFNAEQIRRMKKAIKQKTSGSDVMSLWKGIDLP